MGGASLGGRGGLVAGGSLNPLSGLFKLAMSPRSASYNPKPAYMACHAKMVPQTTFAAKIGPAGLILESDEYKMSIRLNPSSWSSLGTSSLLSYF